MGEQSLRQQQMAKRRDDRVLELEMLKTDASRYVHPPVAGVVNPLLVNPNNPNDPSSDNNRVLSTNRPSINSQQTDIFSASTEMPDPIAEALENTVVPSKGDKKRPSIIRFPSTIASGEFPNIMQFKVFWRWEDRDAKEQVEKLKEETERKVGNLKSIERLVEDGNINYQNLAEMGVSPDEFDALSASIVDPVSGLNLRELMRSDVGRAKQLLEQTITSGQTRLTALEEQLDNGVGKVGKDEQERLMVQGRLNQSVEDSSVLGAGAVAGVVGGVTSLISSGGDWRSAAATGALAGGSAMLAVGAAKVLKNDAVYDQMVSIYLPFCNKITTEDGFDYEDKSQAMAGGLLDATSSPIQTTTQSIYALGETALSQQGAGGAVGAATGKVTNPRLEKLFKQKSFRSFSFSWELFPRNEEDSESIRNLIETFRYHSHPARDADTDKDAEGTVEVILRVPAEFEIRFLSSTNYGGASGIVENEYLPKLSRCALTAVSVDYSPAETFTSYSNNAPLGVVLTLAFSEMGLLTREDVDKGY